jgi:hypothetical protein
MEGSKRTRTYRSLRRDLRSPTSCSRMLLFFQQDDLVLVRDLALIDDSFNYLRRRRPRPYDTRPRLVLDMSTRYEYSRVALFFKKIMRQKYGPSNCSWVLLLYSSNDEYVQYEYEVRTVKCVQNVKLMFFRNMGVIEFWCFHRVPPVTGYTVLPKYETEVNFRSHTCTRCSTRARKKLGVAMFRHFVHPVRSKQLSSIYSS